MHPILATLHPALRTAVLATLLTQGGLLLLAMQSGQSPWIDALPSSGATHLLPAELLLSRLATLLGTPLSGHLFLIAQKLCCLITTLGVYHFCRKDMLPQTAERTTWLFALSPVLLLTPSLPMAIAAACGVTALASAVHGRYLIGAVAALVGTFFFPYLAILSPALLGLGLRARTPHTPTFLPVLLAMSPLIAASLIVFATFMFAGALGISMRALSGALPSLHAVDAMHQGIDLDTSKLIFLAGFALNLVGAYRYAASTPRSWPLITLPLFLLPLCFEQSSLFFIHILLAIPTFAYASKLTEDPARERPLSAMLLLVSALTVLHGPAISM